MKKTRAVVILDGFGYNESKPGNAVAAAGTPNIDRLLRDYPNDFLQVSGRAVGLPEGQMGNSEVGHLNVGAGRVVYQDITRIDKAIEDGDFFTNPAFLEAVKAVKKNGSALHLVGLCSDGGVHSHLNHLYALLRLAKAEKVKIVHIHCITDGRDVPPDSARRYVAEVNAKCKEIGVGKVATVVGRYYYMDRDNRWERVEKGYNAVFAGVGTQYSAADSAIAASYAAGKFDEFIEPMIVDGYKGVVSGDAMIFYNFRSDRAREISRAILYPEFPHFERAGGFKDIVYVGMTQYDETFEHIKTAFGPKVIVNNLGEYLGKIGLTQTHVAETEKYAHVTFFFNGGVEEPNPGESRVLVASPKVATYDLKPQMSAFEVTDKAVEVIGETDVLILNYANCDMVGHTGVFGAAVKAVETVDTCVGRLFEKILAVGGAMILTADHGNAEMMTFPDGAPCTSHTVNPVRVILAGDGITPKSTALREGGKLSDIAPTLLDLLGVEQPAEMEGKTLRVRKA
jgi:2,3-bisphosphoglycerate-independent phosphoglycerate mutase